MTKHGDMFNIFVNNAKESGPSKKKLKKIHKCVNTFKKMRIHKKQNVAARLETHISK